VPVGYVPKVRSYTQYGTPLGDQNSTYGSRVRFVTFIGSLNSKVRHEVAFDVPFVSIQIPSSLGMLETKN
jgi:hypothetical protein